MIIAHDKLIGKDGKPKAAVIPWEVFLTVQKQVESKESQIDDEPLTSEEIEAMAEAEKDRREGNWGVFTPLEEVEKELGIA